VNGAVSLRRLVAFAALVAVGASAASAGVPALSLPVQCEIGKTCAVQNYFDHDAGPGAKDYRCGLLSYDGHDGTDIRLPNLAAMKRGVAVLAAANGRVRAVRDSMDDVSFRVIGKDAVKGREAGNAVAVDHGEGWETQYSHLRRGSVAVKPGQAVKRGQVLGMIGLSGHTEFPHLHLSVRHNGRKIDPFVGTSQASDCGAGATPLWESATQQVLAYAPSGLLSAGFAGAPPSFEAIQADPPDLPGRRADALVFWIYMFGLQRGDLEYIRIFGPDGAILAEEKRRAGANKADAFLYVGRKRRDAGWTAGTYRGEYRLVRGAQEIVSIVRDLHMKP